MSGHSKWSNIKHRKEKTDSQKAKIFTKIGREISVVVKEGGVDPENNTKLRDVIAKARANNMPGENIKRCIKRAAGEGTDSAYFEMTYEGYGPCGVAVIVETLTDNKNRTAGDMRHYFDKFGGNLGQTGCVTFMFERKGVLILSADAAEEDALIDDALELGADDVEVLDDGFEVISSPEAFPSLRDGLAERGYAFLSGEVEFLPLNTVSIESEDDIKNMTKLIDMLEDNDDVQNVYHNWDSAE